MDTPAQQQIQQQQQQQQQQSPTSTKVFTVVETRHLLKILMNPKTLSLFKDNKQSHSFVWNYIYKCMKIKFPKFAKSTRQCYKKYENLKGKYFEIKRAQMNGEQRPYWLYYNEMDYIINHFPGHRPRINTLESTTNATASTANSGNASNSALSSDGSTAAATASNTTEFPEKSLRSSAVAANNLDANDSALTPFVPKKLQLLTLIRNTKPGEFEKKSDGWELVLKKAQNKNLFPLNKTWLDFYYEIWMTHLDDTITKWEAFTTGSRMVRYDETDKIMFDIIKGDWNEYGSNSNSMIRIPTLRTLPTYLEKLKDLRQENLLEDIDSILPEQTDDEQSSTTFLNNSTAKTLRLENGHSLATDSTAHLHDSPANLSNLFNHETSSSPLTQYKQHALQLKNQFIKTKMSAYVEKHNRKCYKMDLELYKIEKELGLPPSEFTQKFAQQQAQQIVTTQHTTTATLNAMTPIPSMHPHPQQQPQPQIITNNIGNAGPQIQAVNGANGTSNAQPVHINDTFFNVDIKREMNFDDGGNFDFV